MLAASTEFKMSDTQMDASDAYSNKQQQPSGPWSGNIWDNMD